MLILHLPFRVRRKDLPGPEDEAAVCGNGGGVTLSLLPGNVQKITLES